MKSAITAMSPRVSKGLITPRLSMLLTPRTRGNLDEAVRATMPEGPALNQGPLAADASILERAARETPMGMTREQLEGACQCPGQSGLSSQPLRWLHCMGSAPTW